MGNLESRSVLKAINSPKRNNYNRAVDMYSSAIQQAPHDSNLHVCRSVAHVMSTAGRLDLALRDADEAIRLGPTHSQGWVQKGEIFIRMGRGAEAVGVLSRALGFAWIDEKLAIQRSLAAAQALSAGRTPSPQPYLPKTSLSLHTTPLGEQYEEGRLQCGMLMDATNRYGQTSLSPSVEQLETSH